VNETYAIHIFSGPMALPYISCKTNVSWNPFFAVILGSSGLRFYIPSVKMTCIDYNVDIINLD